MTKWNYLKNRHKKVTQACFLIWQCSYNLIQTWNAISLQIYLATNIAIDQYFSGIEERHNFLWISKPFSSEESSICDNDMVAKIELLWLREDWSLKTINFAEKDVRNFRVCLQNEYHIPLKKALRYFIQFSLTYTVIARTRIKWMRFRECGEFLCGGKKVLYGGILSDRDFGLIKKHQRRHQTAYLTSQNHNIIRDSENKMTNNFY